jgi:hypothetical protein
VVPQQVRSQDLLGLRADQDDPFASAVLGLVAFGDVPPNFAPGFHVARSQQTDLLWAASGQPLKLNHVGHDRGKVFNRRLDCGIRYRANGFRLACFASPTLETSERC